MRSVVTLGFAFAAAVQATLTKQNIGLLGTFTRYGGTIGIFSTITYDTFRYLL